MKRERERERAGVVGGGGGGGMWGCGGWGMKRDGNRMGEEKCLGQIRSEEKMRKRGETSGLCHVEQNVPNPQCAFVKVASFIILLIQPFGCFVAAL